MPLNPDYESGLDVHRDAISAAVAPNNLDAAHVTQSGMMRKAQRVDDGVMPLVAEQAGVTNR